jgi:hypothetical protein
MALELNGTTGVQGNSGAFVAGTAVASTSGTSIDFTSIPSWVKRITVMFDGVSSNGTSNMQVQLGAGSVTTSGYLSYWGFVTSTSNIQMGSGSAGFGFWNGGNTDLHYMHMTLTKISGNSWVSSHSGAFWNGSATYILNGGGSISLGGTLDRVRITTVNGTDAFDAGTLNILYE